MKRALLLTIALGLLFCVDVNAQMVGATNNQNRAYTTYVGRSVGCSYGLSAVTSLGFNNDGWNSYQYTYGVWLDGGYNLTPQLYVGASLGLQIREETMGYKYRPGRLLADVRYYFTPEASTLFVDLRMGVKIDDPLGEYGRAELGVGYTFNNHFEIAAGLENEMWDATSGFGQLIRTKGLFIRAGYRF